MNAFVVALASLLLLAGCASPPPMPPAADLFRDALFAPPTASVEPGQAMALSAPMREYLESRLLRAPSGVDRRQWLIEALYRRGDLMLAYDASVTRTAAEAFDARSGNCLALVMMTGAFAQAMGLTVRYQAVTGEESFERAGDLAIEVGHVNLTLDKGLRNPGLVSTDRNPWTVDFMPGSGARQSRTRVIDEHTVIAMFLNNRAVESLVAGRADDAYWWAREAIRRDPELLSAYVTLGVVYRTVRQPALAETALARVSARQPDNTQALANRVLALRDLGQQAAASALQQRLDRLDPQPRFGPRGLHATKLDRPKAVLAQ